MTSTTRKTNHELLQSAQNFSVVLGGPLFQLLRRAHLSDDSLSLLRKRIIVIALFAWLPLLVLSALEGHLWGGGVAVPFLKDMEVHIRFLVAVPLLIVAEVEVNRRLLPIAQTFLDRNLIPEDAESRFDDSIKSAFRLRDSVLAEVLIIVAVYAVGVLIVWRHYTALDADTWYGSSSRTGSELSLAGLWYGYVSLPLFQFLLVRWYFRIFIWTRFLWQVSRIKLSLVPTHPDRLGGLGFLPATAYAFGVLLIAHGAMVAAQLANRIILLGANLFEFRVEIAVMLVFLLFVVFGPLLVFSPQLASARRIGLREYGTLAERYVRDFDRKWLRGGAPDDEAFVGSSDIQSLADLGNSFEVVRSMRIIPVTRDALIQLAAFVLVPIAPLALTIWSLEDLAKKLFGILF
ncbi:hypothetical protein [Dyella telluris]|uniref:Uncharacterized protein n=1 Tax=Dyella telluris TaxID=2763498 RepID=A0A7G8Q5S5_9GAMM|nr:hypothetical protein [Dyella telluris]QNK02133.1 hypothetical protein H8F01_02915 [Dyella telluris]